MNTATRGTSRIGEVILERDEQGEELYREFTTIPGPYDENLRGIGYEAYKASCKSDE